MHAVMLIVLASAVSISSWAQTRFEGGIWPDNNGIHINAHGGGILYKDDTYYWFGEDKDAGEKGNLARKGVHCYSSANLVDWKDEGIALKMSEDADSPLIEGCVVERPKVIFNKKTGKYVMWFHHELKDKGYKAALTGLAVSDKAVGPYKYVHSLRPNAGVWPINFPEEKKHSLVKLEDVQGKPEARKQWVADGGFLRRDFEGGQMSRDLTLFVDVDGTAYHISAAEENQTLHVRELSDDYLSFTGKYVRILLGERNEAPAIFRKDGKYYMISSGLTGWAPNPAHSAVASKMMGDWISLGNPCRGTETEVNTTFESQSTYVIDIGERGEEFILMTDRWRPKNAIDGRYIWIRIAFEDGKPVLKWENVFDGKMIELPKHK